MVKLRSARFAKNNSVGGDGFHAKPAEMAMVLVGVYGAGAALWSSDHCRRWIIREAGTPLGFQQYDERGLSVILPASDPAMVFYCGSFPA